MSHRDRGGSLVLLLLILAGCQRQSNLDAPAGAAADAARVDQPMAAAPVPPEGDSQVRTGKAPAEAARRAVYRSVLIQDVPHVRQKPDFCGEACAEMYLKKLGHSLDQDDVYDRSGLDPLLGRGCYTADLARALTGIGFKVGTVQQSVAVANADQELEACWKRLHADLVAGVPSIACMHYDDHPDTTEHFRLILGYDAATDEVLYHEPADEHGAYRRMKKQMLLDLWPLKYFAEQWIVIRLRLDPVKIIKPVRRAAHTDADYCQHVMRLKKKVPGPEFTVLLQRPFMVIGDEPAEMVRRRAEHTVGWAVDRLRQMYFKQDPEQILDIWLFKDKQSYDRHTRQIFGDTPTTPFGYYSPVHRALVMNIATGGGTLVHEIVHPFMASNFPACPSWFNEGLASLYEQSGEEDGRIHGYTNWRLPGLQDFIKAGRLPPFQELCETTTDEFYNQDKGANYAQARYLCYYLQERGLLVKYYEQFKTDCRSDPSGYQSLQAVLGEADMSSFQANWEEYVGKLRFE